MKIFTIIALALIVSGSTLVAQPRDTSLLKRVYVDTSGLKLNLDAVYNRPFLQYSKLPATLGGYVEANTSYFGTDGVSDGFSFQFPRLTLFVASTITDRIKFLTEIELEDGGREINIEFASVDVQFAPLFNLRGGIILNPIGAFNQNHDGPKWEFISRPIASTTIIPSTWSNAGFGLYGKYATKRWAWAYEAYLTNGFDDKIIANSEGRTWLPASKEDTERFNESFNGMPMATTKLALRRKNWGEVGVSWMGGVFNKFQEDGLQLDKRRRVDLYAIDYNNVFPILKTYVTGEFVWAFIDVPRTYTPQFGSQQLGGFVDLVQPIIRKPMLGWQNATLNLAFRGEYADYNADKFDEVFTKVSDHVFATVPGISFRPSSQTVIRANYRYEWRKDILGNPFSRTAGFQFGFSSYF